MLKNYFKIAARNLFKYKVYSLINISGLAIGISCCILILLFVRNELSYDTFHQNEKRIFRVVGDMKVQDRTFNLTNFPMPMGPALQNEIPEIESAVRLQNRTGVVRYNDNLVREELLFCDPDLLKIFSFALLSGTEKAVISERDALVISRAAATKYFAGSNPIGKQISIRLSENEIDFIVKGVIENVPQNSSIQFDFLIPYQRLTDLSLGAAERVDDWFSFNTVTFVMLHDKSGPLSLQTKLKTFSEKYFPDPTEITFQPLSDIHLNPQRSSSGLEPVSDPLYSYLLTAIAIIILVIACINFMTITLGSSTSRTREVGMRKVLGAQRSQLLKQFWSEALLLSFCALCLGVLLAQLFLPVFNSLIDKNLALDIMSDSLIVPGLFLLMLISSLLAGSYPALLLSKFQPVEIFKEKLKMGRVTVLGKSLVILQFSLSILLIICTIVISQQNSYLVNRNLGFNDDQVLVIPTVKEEQGIQLLNRFKTELSTEQNILSIAGAAFSIDRGTHNVGASYQDQDLRSYEFRVDYNYLNTMEMELLEGRNFSAQYKTDPEQSAIVNEAFVKELGWQQALGKQFTFRGSRQLKVIGVVKDFHFESLHRKIGPAVLHMDPATPIRYLMVKIAARDVQNTLSLLQSKWKDLAGQIPFEYYFLDNDVTRQYRSEQRWNDIVSYSSLFAIVIACLGLFGLSSLSVARRTKEIGIRKVLGSSLGGVIGLINREFLALVVLGNLIAWPLSWYVMYQWLQDYAYRIELTFWPFLSAAVIVVVIAIITISGQALRAATANPVESLRYE